MVLYSAKSGIAVNSETQKITGMLSAREKKWDQQQQEKLRLKIEEKFQKAAKMQDYIKKLLKDCKSWSGPCTSAEELLEVIKKNPNKEEFIVKS